MGDGLEEGEGLERRREERERNAVDDEDLSEASHSHHVNSPDSCSAFSMLVGSCMKPLLSKWINYRIMSLLDGKQ